MINPTSKSVLDMLNKLPPQERLKVITQALPEIEQSLTQARKVYKSLRGLWKDAQPSLSAKEIDAARHEILNIPIISRDGKVKASKIKTIW